MTVDFSRSPDIIQVPTGNLQGPVNDPPRDDKGKLLTPKQIRARIRRKVKRSEIASPQEIAALYKKPISEWDMEELANGRPKNAAGKFSGPKPSWVTQAVHEESMKLYTAAVKSSMRGTTVDALEVIKSIINNEDVDDKGKPIVPASTKLEAAKFLLEHVVGKPTQRIEQDLSVRLQGILGQVLVNPAEMGQQQQAYNLGHFPGITMAMAEQGADRGDDDDFIDGAG